MNDSNEPVVRTWDGQPVSPDPPFGAMIVVYRWDENEPTFLLLHRGQFGPDFDEEWAWGPPSGARYPHEDVEVCAARELAEETGFDLTFTRTSGDAADWYVYIAELSNPVAPRLSAEHDRFDWFRHDEAADRISSAVVRAQFIAAASTLQNRPCANRREIRGGHDK